MKFSLFSIALVCAFFAFATAQQVPADNSTKMLLTPTANLAQDYNLTFNTSLITNIDQNDLFRGYVIFSVAGLAEFDFSNEGYVTDMVNNTDKIRTLGLKLKLFSERLMQPAVSFAFRTTLGWNESFFVKRNLIANTPELTEKGLDNVRYDFRTTMADIVFSKMFGTNIYLTAGLGVQELQYQDLRISYASVFPGIHKKSINRNLMLHGFVSGSFNISNNISIMSELQSLPHIKADLDGNDLEVDRSYIATFGVRYKLTNIFILDAAAWHYTNSTAKDITQFRFGLNTILDFNSSI
jgi:hypothetical protein